MLPSPVVASDLSSRLPAEQRLTLLEQQITAYEQDLPRADWLNEYLDLGLELASQAGERCLQALQTSWIRRIYHTLLLASLNTHASGQWRSLCSDYLYQPYFVLQQIYKSSPAQHARLCHLQHEFHATDCCH